MTSGEVRVGIIDLRDLQQRWSWSTRAVDRFVAVVGLLVEGARSGAQLFEPPPIVVAITKYDGESHHARHAASWLSHATAVVIVRDLSDAGELRSDAELRTYNDTLWRENTLTMTANVIAVVDWTDDAACRAALATALDAASKVAPRSSHRTAPCPGRELASGGWTQIRFEWPTSLHAFLSVRGDGVWLRDASARTPTDSIICRIR
jgi:hypothetical protein